MQHVARLEQIDQMCFYKLSMPFAMRLHKWSLSDHNGTLVEKEIQTYTKMYNETFQYISTNRLLSLKALKAFVFRYV